ncbi:MAG: hypothetical protein CML73_01890 [Rhodobiaceae bacterium]|nr:hypothetical protein [Rhodobiaceae bacterium]
MPRIEANWSFPQFTGYSILNLLNPAICWQEPRNNPLIKKFRVQVYFKEDARTLDLGATEETYMAIPSDDYSLTTSYKIRIATIGTDGKQSSFVESDTLVASPLRFDFSSLRSVTLPEGQKLKSQRLLFLII